MKAMLLHGYISVYFPPCIRGSSYEDPREHRILHILALSYLADNVCYCMERPRRDANKTVVNIFYCVAIVLFSGVDSPFLDSVIF